MQWSLVYSWTLRRNRRFDRVAVQREAGIKGFRQFFSGIGGILDLLDSLLFNAPIMYLYLRHVLK